MEMIRLAVGPLETNCYIIWDPGTRASFIIDPGGDARGIEAAVRREGLDVKYIVNTHGHFDHVGADGELKNLFNAKIALHPGDVLLLREAHIRGEFFGVETPRQPEADILLEDGGVLEDGGLSLRVIHTPGHTEGGVSLYSEKDKTLFTGDTLFAGSVGRTDLDGGSFEKLMDSIRRKLLKLPDDVRVFPGHGPATTIGEEKRANPFVATEGV